MLATYATGLIAVVAMMLLWIMVQNAWRRVFTDGEVGDAVAEPDVLARRKGCDGCSCTGVCRRKTEERGSREDRR